MQHLLFPALCFLDLLPLTLCFASLPRMNHPIRFHDNHYNKLCDNQFSIFLSYIYKLSSLETYKLFEIIRHFSKKKL